MNQSAAEVVSVAAPSVNAGGRWNTESAED